MAWFSRRPTVPDPARAAIALASGERILAAGTDQRTSDEVVATTYRLAVVSGDGQLRWSRPWHEATTGVWQKDSTTLTVTWADGSRPSRFVLPSETLLPRVVRERLQASVVLAEEVTIDTRRRVRVAIREDLATRELLDQVVPGRGTDVDDPEVRAAAGAMLARLRGEVGL